MALIAHTADWHIGRNLLGCDRRDDHRAVLAEVCEQIEQRRPDLVVHSGDVFDGLRPATEDLQLAIEMLQRIAEVAPTIVLMGNHDSPAYFRLFSTILGDQQRLRFLTCAKEPKDGGIIDVPTDAGQRIRVAAVPFIHENRQIDWFGDPQRFMADYSGRIATINEVLGEGLADGYDAQRDVLLYAAHLYVAGAHWARSERPLHVSDVYATRSETLPHVSYAAFGHIHKPQQLPGAQLGHYCGSTLQLDFGEQGEQKSLVFVTAEPGQPAAVELVPLQAGRRVIALRGGLEQIAASAEAAGDALVKVIVDTDEPIADLSDRVREALPDATFVDIQQALTGTKLQSLGEAELDEQEQLGVNELFARFLSEHGTRTAAAELVHELFCFLDQAASEEKPPRDWVPAVRELLGTVLPAAPALEAPIDRQLVQGSPA